MTFSKSVTVTNRGMISIPAELRRKYDIKDGDKISVIEDEEGIKLIPIEDLNTLRSKGVLAKEIMEIMRKARKEDLELEY
ncbi:MAG: AbrB/MazE/SpoVT family DNA-binding domain-containing protein [Promethearchaeota archaeon]